MGPFCPLKEVWILVEIFFIVLTARRTAERDFPLPFTG